MPLSIPGTGWPDHEERAMPHGDTLDQATGQTALATGTVIDNAGDGWHVAAYRSLVVQVMNDDVVGITVTPRWSFWNQSSSAYTEDIQTVPAGTHKRLLFQNQADFVQQITFTGVGANAAFRYYVTGSNLDPLVRSRLPCIFLVGTNSGIQTSVSGVGFNCWFQKAGGVSYQPDPDVFAVNTVSPGVCDTVTYLQPGMYVMSGGFLFESAAAFVKAAGLVSFTGPGPPLNSFVNQDAFDANEQHFGMADMFEATPANVAASLCGTRVTGAQASGGNVGVANAYLRIVQLSAVAS